MNESPPDGRTWERKATKTNTNLINAAISLDIGGRNGRKHNKWWQLSQPLGIEYRHNNQSNQQSNKHTSECGWRKEEEGITSNITINWSGNNIDFLCCFVCFNSIDNILNQQLRLQRIIVDNIVNWLIIMCVQMLDCCVALKPSQLFCWWFQLDFSTCTKITSYLTYTEK